MERVFSLQPIKTEKRVDCANAIRSVWMRVSQCVHASECVLIGLRVPYFNFQSCWPILTKFDMNVIVNPNVKLLFSFLASNTKMCKKNNKCTLVLWCTFIYNTFTNMFRLVIRPSSGCCFWYKNTIVAKCVTVTTGIKNIHFQLKFILLNNNVK